MLPRWCIHLIMDAGNIKTWQQNMTMLALGVPESHLWLEALPIRSWTKSYQSDKENMLLCIHAGNYHRHGPFDDWNSLELHFLLPPPIGVCPQALGRVYTQISAVTFWVGTYIPTSLKGSSAALATSQVFTLRPIPPVNFLGQKKMVWHALVFPLGVP